MHLVYRAREKEPVPSILPISVIPPSKRKKGAVALPGSVPVLPSSPFLLKENLRPTAPLSKSPLTITSNLSPSNSFRSSSPSPSPSPAPQLVHTHTHSRTHCFSLQDSKKYLTYFYKTNIRHDVFIKPTCNVMWTTNWGHETSHFNSGSSLCCTSTQAFLHRQPKRRDGVCLNYGF